MGKTFTLANASCASWGPIDLGAVGGGQTMSHAVYPPASSSTVLQKRPRDADGASGDRFEAYDDQGRDCRKKMKMATNGVLGVAWHTSRARRKPSAKTPVRFNGKSEAAGRGAERLAPLNAHELYHRFLLGPSVQKESTETPAQEKLPWVEGREQEATWQHENSAVQPQEAISSTSGIEEDAAGELFKIPKRLSERHKGLLKATPEDWTRGAIREPKCRLCPGAAFSNWEDFKRHCDLMEAHPLRISFCGYCGDFFARADSLARHRKNRPPECLSVTLEEALAKRRETERVHAEFQEKLERCLGTEEVIETPFAQTVKEMFPGSSKRGSRQQSRLKAQKSESS